MTTVAEVFFSFWAICIGDAIRFGTLAGEAFGDWCEFALWLRPRRHDASHSSVLEDMAGSLVLLSCYR